MGPGHVWVQGPRTKVGQTSDSKQNAPGPLSGVKRTWLGHDGMSIYDPKRTFWSELLTFVMMRSRQCLYVLVRSLGLMLGE
jgi:hypothetical protein